jgi:hypothetical protein
MLIVMVVVGSMMTAGAVLVRMQLSSSNASHVNHSATVGLYCAEAGLTAVRDAVIANVASWNAALVDPAEPAFLSAISRDIDGDGASDFTISLRDNDDEPVNDLTMDTDLTVFVVSTCIKHPDTRTQVTELVTSTGQRKLWLRTE